MMIRHRKGLPRKELLFPVIVVKSDYPVRDQVCSSRSINKDQDFDRPRRFGRTTHLCYSERLPRPKPERDWSPMSSKEEPLKSAKGYGRDGLYSKHVDNLYQVLTRQNSIMLPSVKTSKRMKRNKYDDDKLREKQYIMKDFFTEGKMSKFARDQCYVPSVYSQYLKCKTCKKSYMNDKYIEEYKKRNQRAPVCSNPPITKKSHFCDVLGKRYCGTCIESENRQFSRQIEDRLQGSIRGSTSSLTDLCSEFG